MNVRKSQWVGQWLLGVSATGNGCLTKTPSYNIIGDICFKRSWNLFGSIVLDNHWDFNLCVFDV